MSRRRGASGGVAKELMDEHFPGSPRVASGTQSRTGILVGFGLGAFLLGAAAVWLITGADGISGSSLFEFRNGEERAATAPAPRASPSSTQVAAAQVAAMAQQQGGLDQRVAAMEQRLTRLDLQAQASAGNAARAEGLLIAFATRRALERGDRLGYLEDQLQLRFGAAQPEAVRTVIEASQKPVTLDRLLARLEGLAPDLSEAPESEGVFSWLSRELGDLFVVRREDSPSPAPVRRLDRARQFLESGRTEAAVSEVRNLPNAAGAASWIADAERYSAAQRALELLETAAILEPRELRDASGNSVQQLSPVVPR